MVKIGDRVTTDFRSDERYIVRKIINMRPHDCKGGYLVSVDGGGICPKCKRTARPIYDISIAWVIAHPTGKKRAGGAMNRAGVDK